MAKALTVAALIAISALCFTALAGLAQADDSPSPSPSASPLVVEGKVYCDTCRVKFETQLSEPINGATVKLMCRDRDSQENTLEKETETDESGRYKFEVDGDHENEICEVHLIKSTKDDCNEIVKGWNAARVSLTADEGLLVDPVRHANALGFMKKEALKTCGDVLQSMGFLPV